MEKLPRPSSPRTALTANRRLVIEALRASGDLTRPEICEASGLSAAAVARITNRLEQERLIARVEQRQSLGGRRAWRYRFTGEGRSLAGIRVRRSSCQGVLLDWREEIVARVDVENDPQSVTGDRILEATRECVLTLHQAGQEVGRPPVAMGIAVPAVVGADGRVFNGNEVGWSDLDLEKALAEQLTCPLLIENDANVLAVSELVPGEHISSLAALILGYGLGAGIVSEGRLLRGAHRSAGEIGYLLPDRTPRSVPGARQGELEGRIRRAAAAGLGDPVPTLRLWELLDDPDPAASQAGAEILDYLAQAVASVVVVVDPERVVIGDVPARHGERLLRELAHRLEGLLIRDPVVTLARRGPEAVLLGAALLAADTVDLQAM